MERKSILVVSEKESIIVRSIEKKVSELRYTPIMTRATIEDVESNVEEASLFIAYLPDDVTDKYMKCLLYLADNARDLDKCIFLIGDIRLREIIMSQFVILGDSVRWFNRPLDMDELERKINRAFSDNERHASMKRILVVDDDPAYARMVKEWLDEKFKVDVVTSGAQCINFLSRNQVDLILLDYEMPVVDGPKVLQMLRSEAGTQDIPVFFLTGVSKKDSVAKVLSLKPQGYILKSATKEDLIININNFFLK